MGSNGTSKRATGGAAAERGLDFQARASAVVMAHLLAERPLGWLEGVLDDTLLELRVETGGPGDDIGFSVKDGKHVELQAKRGLQRGDRNWGALMDLSRAISGGTIDAGVLAMCPNSSGTIREDLAEDIVRLGAGRTDGLRAIGREWAAQLSESTLDATLVCRRWRIVVVSVVDGNREAEATAAERLDRIVQEQGAAWSALVEYGRRFIRRRERSTPEDIYRTLSLANIQLKTTEVHTRIQLSVATRQWLHRTYSSMTVLGALAKAYQADPERVTAWLRHTDHVIRRESVRQLREQAEAGQVRQHEGGTGRPRKRRPALVVSHQGKRACLLLNRSPEQSGQAWIRYDQDGRETEMSISEVKIIGLRA